MRIVAITAAIQWRAASIRVGVLFGLTGMLGAIPGAWLNHHVSPTLVLLGFATTMLGAAARMGGVVVASEAVTHNAVAPGRAALLGVGVGMATGFFGVGGGFLIVPALRLFLDVPIRRAAATSLLVIALNSFAGLAGLLVYGSVDWRLGVELTTAALAGVAITLPLARQVRGPVVQRSFAVVLAMVGLVMLGQTVREMVT